MSIAFSVLLGEIAETHHGSTVYLWEHSPQPCVRSSSMASRPGQELKLGDQSLVTATHAAKLELNRSSMHCERKSKLSVRRLKHSAAL